MLGFAIIKDDGHTIAIWLVSRTGNIAANTNAYVCPTDVTSTDPTQAIRNLTHDRVVLGDSTVLDRLAVQPAGFLSLDQLAEWDKDRQSLQVEMNSFVERTNKNWKVPFETTALVPPPLQGGYAEARYEALAVADYLHKVWTNWLKAENERVKRAREENNRVPDKLSSPDHRAVLLKGFEEHQWVGASFASAPSTSEDSSPTR